MNKIILSVSVLLIVVACYTGANSEPVLNDVPTDLASLLQGKLLPPKEEPSEYKLATGVTDVLASTINFFLRIAGFFIAPILGVFINIFEALTLHNFPFFDLWHLLLSETRNYFLNIGKSSEQQALYYVN
ncbi:hypothetical protein Trydic_g5612 [Trypoxylus dichotomus]